MAYVTKAQNGWTNDAAKQFGLKKITLAEVKKAIKENGRWQGYMVGNNVNPYHVNANWHLGMWSVIESLENLQTQTNAFLVYLDKELGNGIHYYEKLKP